MLHDSPFRRWIENWIACHLVKLSKENFCHRFLIKEQDNLSKCYAGVSEIQGHGSIYVGPV